jgi:hypothetical protein
MTGIDWNKMGVDLEMVLQDLVWTQIKAMCRKLHRETEVNQEIQSM